MHKKIMLFSMLVIAVASFGQSYPLKYVNTGTKASFRGLSVARDGSVWVSGKGCLGRSTNRGDDWKFRPIPRYEQYDFRSIYAFDSNNAVIANAGSLAYILRTADGGASWKLVYTNTDSAAFIDGICFWNKKHGIIHGDPVGGRMLLLSTSDGGRTWKAHKEQNRPRMNEGEASFAASGTSMSCLPHRTVVVATGGKTARLFISRNRGKKWKMLATPMTAGAASKGIFSFMPTQYVGLWFIAGGDYKQEAASEANLFYTTDKGKTWKAPTTNTRGYRECLAWISTRERNDQTKAMFAVGPSGMDISTDRGETWQPLNDEKGFHAIKPSVNHDRLYLVGANGKVAVMTER